jgi:hypothetical protein
VKTIFKYPLTTDAPFVVTPVGAQILCVQVQRGTPCLWALVERDAPLERRHFMIYGTGHPHDGGGVYVGTYQLEGGALVFHVFERGRP